MIDINTGDVVIVSNFLGLTSHVTVTQPNSDTINGEPVFDGVTLDGTPVWRQHKQVISIYARSAQREFATVLVKS